MDRLCTDDDEQTFFLVLGTYAKFAYEYIINMYWVLGSLKNFPAVSFSTETQTILGVSLADDGGINFKTALFIDLTISSNFTVYVIYVPGLGMYIRRNS